MLDKFQVEPQDPIRLTPALFLRLGLALTLSLAITIPFNGVLVRYRVNYSPKVVQLDGDDGATQLRNGPAINGYFSMLKRVYRLEGWAGLYKGIIPAVSVALLSILYTGIRFAVEGPGGFSSRYPQPMTAVRTLITLRYSVGLVLVTLPYTILSDRAITTPYKLPYFGLNQSLRALLTPTELVRPWVLWLTPGLLVAAVLRALVSALIIMPLEFSLLPKLPNSKEDMDKIFILRSFLYLFATLLSTSIVVPLQIMTDRLAIQRNHASYESIASQEEPRATSGEPPVYPGAVEEDVIGFRNEADPYLSFIDCARRMVVEEGYGTLFRAWWISFIPLLAAGIFVAKQKQA